MIMQELQELFNYNNGRLYWKIRSARCIQIGDMAGYLSKGGYRCIKIYRKLYLEHRLIWIYYNGDIPDGMQIDHINRIRDDNRIENLRLVTPQENNFNSSSKGYRWNKKGKKWISSIKVDGKKKYLGSFKNEEDARQAYLNAKEIYHVIKDRV